MLSKLFSCSEVNVNANYSCFLIKLSPNIKYCRKKILHLKICTLQLSQKLVPRIQGQSVLYAVDLQ